MVPGVSLGYFGVSIEEKCLHGMTPLRSSDEPLFLQRTIAQQYISYVLIFYSTPRLHVATAA